LQAALIVADQRPAQAFIEVRLGIIRPRGQRLRIARQCFVEPPHFVQRHAAIAVRFGIIGPHHERPVVARQRIFEAIQPMERDATIGQRFRMIGRQS
jgi:hypothetical protein